ncbi:glycosyltransferase [Candidatus Woesearchaeota archaeon]|nr:glycosyltransferase [Candidatus Woesearchaeota archaeon]
MRNLSIIIPAYNEGKRISSVLESILRFFGEDVNVLVVSNGSKDDTVKILIDWKTKHKNLNFLEFSEKLGKGGAIVEGLKIVNSDLIGFIDADDAFDLGYIKKILDESNDRFDCIIASKWKGRNFFQVNEPKLRKILSRGWNLFVRIFLNLEYRDTQAGAKFFKKKVKDSIGFNFISTGFAFDVELLKKIQNKKFHIEEVYVPSKHIEGSTFKIRHCSNMLKDLINIWRHG